MNNIKQVLIIRKDLNMRKGKIDAQCAHASMKVFFDKIEKWQWDNEEDCEFCLYQTDCFSQGWQKRDKTQDPDVYPNSIPCKAYDTNVYKTFFNKAMKQWVEWKEGQPGFTKIVVTCKDEIELFNLQKQAEEAKIVNAIILDNEATEFKEICPVCNGQGNNLQISGPDNMCSQCNGTGKINKPTYTCLAIGPDEADKIDKITGYLLPL